MGKLLSYKRKGSCVRRSLRSARGARSLPSNRREEARAAGAALTRSGVCVTRRRGRHFPAVAFPAGAGEEAEDEDQGAADGANVDPGPALLPGGDAAELDALGGFLGHLGLPGAQVEKHVPRGLVPIRRVLLE